jgi:methyltransferase (TIGR00027 family)
MRLFIAVRTRFAEDALSEAVERGTRQLVILGAGLDTYAYRNPFRDHLRIFEVDHPDTQAWKRNRLVEAGIGLPDSLTFAPVDFERQRLDEGLASAGFDREHQSFFSWLGVAPYLTVDVILSTLGFIAGLPNGAHVVFDYSNPPDSLSPELRAGHDSRAEAVAALGEPFVSYFDEDDLRARLTGLAFNDIEDLGPRQIASRYFPNRAGPLHDKGGHIVRATALRNIASAPA